MECQSNVLKNAPKCYIYVWHRSIQHICIFLILFYFLIFEFSKFLKKNYTLNNEIPIKCQENDS